MVVATSETVLTIFFKWLNCMWAKHADIYVEHTLLACYIYFYVNAVAYHFVS